MSPYDYLYIKESSIDGLGLFTDKELLSGQFVCKARDSILSADIGSIDTESKFLHRYFQSKYAGFGNHNPDSPNCETYCDHVGPVDWLKDGLFLATVSIRTIRKISTGEELTWKYTLYDPAE